MTPATSDSILAEYRRVLGGPKFRLTERNVADLLAPFRRCGVHVAPTRTLAISPHEADNRILECAQAAQADYLITGNLRHFPQTHGPTRILNARAFLELIQT